MRSRNVILAASVASLCGLLASSTPLLTAGPIVQNPRAAGGFVSGRATGRWPTFTPGQRHTLGARRERRKAERHRRRAARARA